jgi:hypothetical protein
MSSPFHLTGIKWHHSRAFPPLVATAQRYEETHPGVRIHWQKRTLDEFGHAPVDVLAPAVIRMAMVDALQEAQVKYMTEKIPMKRCDAMDEFAAMAAFILSRKNSFTTGFEFDLTGGRPTY